MACGRPLRRLSRHAVVSALFSASAVAFLVLSVGIFILGIVLKREAYKLAIQNGMDIRKPV